MGTIKSVLDNYENNRLIITIKNAFGKELIDEVKASGGELVVNEARGTYHFENVGEELQERLDAKIFEVKNKKW